MSNKVAKYYLQSKRNRERKTKNKNMRKDFLKFKTEKRFVLTVVVPQCRGSAISTNSGQKLNFVNENRSYLFKWNPSLHDSLMTVENFFKFPEYSKMIFFSFDFNQRVPKFKFQINYDFFSCFNFLPTSE